jgi:hypothetical protein
VPWDRLSLWKWVPGISLGGKAASAFGWRTTTLVVSKVEKIRGLNLPGTPWATSACRGIPLLYFYTSLVTYFFPPTFSLCIYFSKVRYMPCSSYSCPKYLYHVKGIANNIPHYVTTTNLVRLNDDTHCELKFDTPGANYSRSHDIWLLLDTFIYHHLILNKQINVNVYVPAFTALIQCFPYLHILPAAVASG